MNRSDVITLARIANQAAPIFKENGWVWQSTDKNGIVPDPQHILDTLIGLVDAAEADVELDDEGRGYRRVSTGRFAVTREVESGMSWIDVSLTLGTLGDA